MTKKLLSIILTLTMILSVVPMRVMADDIVLGDAITWEISDDGTLTVSGEGKIADNYSYKSHWKDDYNDKIKKVVVEDGITEIGMYTFGYLTELEEATIADSVKKISNSAFSGCSSLKTIVLPKAMDEIGSSAFSGCVALEALTMPETLTNMYSSVFENCSSLKSIKIPEGITLLYELGNCSSLESISLPDSLQSLGYNALKNHSSLKTLHIPKNVISIDDSALQGLTSLEEITIDEENNTYTVTQGGLFTKSLSKFILYPAKKEGTLDLTVMAPSPIIGPYAFANCTGLTDLILPTYIYSSNFDEYSALENCTGLKNITVPFTSFNDFNTLSRCEGLVNIYVHEGNQYYTSVDGVIFNADLTNITCYPAGREGAYHIPEGVTYINYSAFKNAKKLTEITMADTVKNIDTYAFYDCSALKSVTFSKNLKHLDSDSFYNCTSLEIINLPASVSSVESQISSWATPAFNGCSSLKEINVDYENETFTSLDGVLYTKDLSKLVMFPQAKEGDYEIPDGVVEIKNYAFADNKSLTSVIMPDSVTKLYQNSFYNNTALQTVRLSYSLTELNTFNGCSALESIDIPPSVKTLGGFRGCTSLEEVIIPYGVTKLSASLLADCTALNSLTIPSSVTLRELSICKNCPELLSINFAGTRAQWRNMKVSYGDPFQDYLGRLPINYCPVVPVIVSAPRVTKSGDEFIFHGMHLENVQEGTALVALVYDDDVVTGINTVILESDGFPSEIIVTAEEGNTAKIFFWDSLDYMTPLCEAIEIKIPIIQSGGGGGGTAVPPVIATATPVTPTETPIPSAPSGGGGDSSSNVSASATPTPEVDGE